MKDSSQLKKILYRSVALTATSAVLTVGSAGIQRASAAESVVFAYPTNISISNAPTLMAVGMGYFK